MTRVSSLSSVSLRYTHPTSTSAPRCVRDPRSETGDRYITMSSYQVDENAWAAIAVAV